MPFIGWYRKLVCQDIFVSRSFVKDESTIKNNLKEFHQEAEKRMLFLSPEGVIVDHGEKDQSYIHACRDFAKRNDMKPFDYVLTPRYKGTNCLLEHIGSRGPLISICLVFVRDGKLLNCKLLSPDRVVPDIYDLNQGIAGAPVSIYIHLRKINVDCCDHNNKNKIKKIDAKSVLLNEYVWKDSVLGIWESRLLASTRKQTAVLWSSSSSITTISKSITAPASSKNSLSHDDDPQRRATRKEQQHYREHQEEQEREHQFVAHQQEQEQEQEKVEEDNHRENYVDKQYTKLEVDKLDIILNHILHATIILVISSYLGHLSLLKKVCTGMFWCLATMHTIGWLANQSSMESVPFETGIKAVISLFSFSK